MTRNEFMRSLRSTQDLLNQLGILEYVAILSSLVPSTEFKRCALSPSSSYSQLYRAGLRTRDYNFLLRDYSYFEFTHLPSEDQPSLRYAFYPNPFDRSVAEDISVIEECDYETYLQILSEQEEDPRTTMLRYDVAVSNYVELRHPVAHFHIGSHQESRWPVDKILSPLAFTLISLKLFSPVAWADELDERLARAKGDCTSLPVQHFSLRERRHLYFT